jgi:uncharacterized protein
MPSPPLTPRHAVAELEEALSTARAVNLVGPRQVGKTTLVRDLLGLGSGRGRFITLDDDGVRAAIEADPFGQLEALTSAIDDGPLVIDEAQRAAGLALAVKRIVDIDRRRGRFLLTGSSNPFARANIADSLAGRLRTVRLWPLSSAEIEGAPPCPLIDWALGPAPNVADLAIPTATRAEVIDRMLRGGYPDVRSLDPRPRGRLLRDHLDAMIGRDAADIAEIRNPGALARLAAHLAARTAQELVVAEFGRLLQIRRETLESYLHTLSELGFAWRLPAWSSGESRRDVKAAKWHVTDTGLAAAQRRLEAADFDATGRPEALGPLLESFVVDELERSAPHAARETAFHHWRSADRREIDLLVDAGDALIAVEVKASTTVSADDVKAIRWFASDGPGRARRVTGIVLHLGREPLVFGDRLFALPVSTLWSRWR